MILTVFLLNLTHLLLLIYFLPFTQLFALGEFFCPLAFVISSQWEVPVVEHKEGQRSQNICSSGSWICRDDSDSLCHSMEGLWFSRDGSLFDSLCQDPGS